ncbi:hypothetical protein FBU30_006528 [Linnemannia zychae]|nr:hypothetical protein FBU30_006528 [Linnemannia zychae]
MRPDPHKQAASRKYHNKVKARGGSTAGTTAGSASSSSRGSISSGRGGSGARGRGGRRSEPSGFNGGNSTNDGEEEEGGSDEDNGYVPRKSYARRKIVSNADRYIELDEEVNEEEELEQGIDRQTIAFRELLKDSDQKKTFDPDAYFRFKSEKEVEAQDTLEESQQARKLLEIRLNDIENALMTLSIKDRLRLRDSDVKALDQDIIGKVSLTNGKPIVPKLVRGQVATDMLIKPSAGSAAAISTATTLNQHNKAPLGLSEANKQDDDLDELLDVTKSYGRARLTSPVPVAAPLSPNPTTATTGETRCSKSIKNSTDGNSPPVRKILPPLKKGPPTHSAKKTDEAWLDSVLGM